MIIENKKNVIGLHIRRRFFLLLLAITLVLLIFKDSFLGIDRIVYFIGLNGLYIIYYIWGTIRDYNYLYYNDLGPKLIFKYYFLALLVKRKRTIEIDKDNFYKFQINKKWMGLRIYLVLYEQQPGGIAKYPPVSMGLLKNKEINKIMSSLLFFSKEERDKT